MKDETLKYYQEAINKTIAYIEQHLDENLLLADLAELANLSTFHFHRVFKAVTSLTLNEYIIRLRVEKGANYLGSSSETISTIAFKCGFSSIEPFTRTFSKYYGVSPSAFKKEQHQLLKMKREDSYPQIAERVSDPEVRYIEAMKVAYIRHNGSYDQAGETWKRIIRWGYKKWLTGWKVKTIGIIHDNPDLTEEQHIRYDACIVIRKEVTPEGEVGIKTIAGGKYAIFHYKGAYEYLSKVYDHIFSILLTSDQFTLDDRPAFELYLNTPQHTKKENLLTDIYIPLV